MDRNHTNIIGLLSLNLKVFVEEMDAFPESLWVTQGSSGTREKCHISYLLMI